MTNTGSRRGVDKSVHGKFYFQHLDEAGRGRFIELYNGKQMKLGYWAISTPGRTSSRA